MGAADEDPTDTPIKIEALTLKNPDRDRLITIVEALKYLPTTLGTPTTGGSSAKTKRFLGLNF
jgi:hypothetical protein